VGLKIVCLLIVMYLRIWGYDVVLAGYDVVLAGYAVVLAGYDVVLAGSTLRVQ
jgi:hypothetical protein